MDGSFNFIGTALMAQVTALSVDPLVGLGRRLLSAPALACGMGVAILTSALVPLKERTLGEITNMMRDLVDPFSYLEIPASDPLFANVLVWLRAAVRDPKRMSVLNGSRRTEVVRTDHAADKYIVDDDGSYRYDPSGDSISFSADMADTVYVVFEGRTIAASCKRLRSCSSSETPVSGVKTLTLRIMGRDSGPLKRLVEEAKREADERAAAYTTVFKPEAMIRWRTADRVTKYDMANSKHDPKMLGDLIEDLRRFFDRKELYASKGRRWKRGILLYGPPGSGKSTLIHLLASHFGRSIAHADSLKSVTAKLAKNLPSNTILVFEDVDCGPGVTRDSTDFATVLNVLDGFSDYQDGMVVIMTTNHVGKIDPALLRPGRMDVKFFVGQPNDEQCKAMYCNFFASSHQEMARIDLEGRRFDYSAVPTARYDEAVAFVEALKQESCDGDLADAFGSPIMSCAFIENVLGRALEPQYALETLRQCIDEARTLSGEQRKDRDRALREEARCRGLIEGTAACAAT
ncbi:BCS1 N and AAA ATPase domain containing protein [Pandoravirus neocaledonia]|uniref:BCS1 N and AAA ATPase domain containing protein n=1 Tax=Pandoravirus neocaledonia TaxID=2107708 RepID=A0A2U7UD98_9VIRU|nr:BCS1 N and AAA ATPase domain containing protein [Pandoravirus neocaledonia]AVK76413.1 BCS1 N and AAA ATPase domain containing protein [Pandoravirus neocaledonia]